MDEPDEYIDFMAKYRDWVSIKRLGIRDYTKPEEIVYHLAGIRASIDNHSYGILGIKTDALDSIAKEITSGKSRTAESFGSLIDALNSADVKRRIREACGSDTSAKLAVPYILNRALSEMGHETSIAQASMSKLYPELKLKPPRGMGRVGKKKGATPDG